MVESRLGRATPENRISNEMVERIPETASECNLPVFAHVTKRADFEAAVDMGVDVIAHNMGDSVETKSMNLVSNTF